jgi:hypothetical protein
MPTANRTRIELDLIPGRFAIVRLDPGSPAPAWARSSTLFSVTTTKTETSVLCDDISLPDGITAQRGYRCFRVRGPLDFALVGILHRLLKPLATAGISVFVISTFDTDYVLVPEASSEAAVAALTGEGHAVHRDGDA